MATEPWYCTREAVASALETDISARAFPQLARCIGSGARAIEGLTHRKFFPQLATRYFDWPGFQYAAPWRLYLEEHEVISVSALTVGGVAVSAALWQLEPNTGPPYTRIEMRLGASGAFGPGDDAHQRAVGVTGLFGHSNSTVPAGTAAEALDTTETDLDVSDGSLVGVGQVLTVDNERLIVTERTWLDSGQNTTNALGVSTSEVTVGVADGTAYRVGELLLVDAERMLIVDIAGNNLFVKRARDGSVLAAHSSNADVFVSRRLTVERGALGTTATTHLTAAPLLALDPPAPVRDLNVAEAIVQYEQETSGYGRTVGAGDNEREASGRGLRAMRDDVYTRYGRKARKTAI